MIALMLFATTGKSTDEIKEVLVHLYAYAGFPRSLNALFAFMEVLDERKTNGNEDAMGKEPNTVPPDLDKDEYGAKVRANLAGLETDISGAKWQRFSPDILLECYKYNAATLKISLLRAQRQCRLLIFGLAQHRMHNS